MSQTLSSPRAALLLTPEYGEHSWGGLGTYVHQVVTGLLARDIQVDVAVEPTYVAATTCCDHSDLPHALLLNPADPASQLAAIMQAGTRRYDAVYVQHAQAARLVALMIEQSLARRVIAAAHLPSYSGFSYFDKPDDDARQQANEALLFRFAHRVVAPSHFAADVLLQVHRLDPADIAVIPLGASRSSDTPRERSVRVRPLTVMSVGRIAKQKGLEDLCEIVAHIPADVATFVHVGSPRAPEDAAYLRSAGIATLGWRPHAEVLRLLCEADLILSTSMYETFGLAMLEGMAAGAVPVAFESGALHELFSHGVSGVFVPAGDTHGAVDTITALHRNPNSLCDLRLGALRAARRFPWRSHLDDLTPVLFG
jgi:glycosyltransferase involved in cell wall biosynthesis